MDAYTYTSDIPVAFFIDLIGYARRLGVEPLALLRPLMNESGLSAKSHNPVGDAVGIFQAMPQTLRNLDFDGDWHAFQQLDADEQLPFLFKYYLPYAGRMPNATAVYLATFAPAWLAHSVDPTWVICAKDGTGNPYLGTKTCALWYVQNRGLDVNNEGRIDVGDLTAAITRADRGPRWDELVARLNDAIEDARAAA